MTGRSVILLSSSDEDRHELAQILGAGELALDLQPARSAIRAREAMLARPPGALVLGCERVGGPNAQAVSLRSLFSGSAAGFAKDVPVVVVLDQPSREDVTHVLGALTRAKVRRFELIVRQDQAAALPKAMRTIFGARAEAGPAKPPPAAATYASLIDSLRHGNLVLPGVPAAVLKIRAMVDAGETSSEALAEVVELDPAVTAMVLRLAGSASYRSARRVRNVREAIMRIGAIQVARIAETSLARGCFVAKSASLGRRLEEAWTHTLARALVVRYAARFDGPDHQERQFLQAMLADVGAAFLANAVHELNPAAIDEPSLVDFIHANHQLVGAALLESWGAPAECVELARVHHDHADTDEMPKRLLFATRAAAGLGFATPFERVEAISLEDAGAALNILDGADADRLRREVASHLSDLATARAA